MEGKELMGGSRLERPFISGGCRQINQTEQLLFKTNCKMDQWTICPWASQI